MDTEINETTQEIDFDSFLDGISDDPGNQTETDRENSVLEAENEEPQEGAGDAESEESSEGESASDEKEYASKEDSESDKAESEQSFVIKVNKEERTLTREEVIAAAQKGYDYDRVKHQRDENQQAVNSLREEVAKFAPLQERINAIAEKAGISPDEMVDGLYINYMKSKGMDEATARESLRADKLQRELDAERNQKQATSEDAMTQRGQREFQEFQSVYPDVELSDEVIQAIKPDIMAGVSLLNAYQKHENATQASRISELEKQNADLERQLQAVKQNQKNRKAAMGSQKDSGGAKNRDLFDDFLKNI